MSEQSYQELTNLPPPPRRVQVKWSELNINQALQDLLDPTTSVHQSVREFLSSRAEHNVTLLRPREQKDEAIQLRANTPRAAALILQLASVAANKHDASTVRNAIDSIYQEEACILYHKNALKSSLLSSITLSSEEEANLYAYAEAIVTQRQANKAKYKSQLNIALWTGGMIGLTGLGILCGGLGGQRSPGASSSPPIKELISIGAIMIALAILLILAIAYKYAKTASIEDPITQKEIDGYEQYLDNSTTITPA